MSPFPANEFPQIRRALGRNRAVVLVFLSMDCPIANSYAPEIRRLRDAFSGRDFAFFAIYCDPRITVAQAKKHARDFGHGCEPVVDSGLRLARFVGAKVTPEVAVLVKQKRALTACYRGRIDNRYLAPGKKRSVASVFDLRDTLEKLARNETIAPRVTEAVGCFLPDPSV